MLIIQAKIYFIILPEQVKLKGSSFEMKRTKWINDLSTNWCLQETE